MFEVEQLTIHPICEAMSKMSPPEFTALKESIKEYGLTDPIWVMDGQILDGRHRYAACRELEIDCRQREYKGDKSLAAIARFVESMRDARRHESSTEKAIRGARLANIVNGHNRHEAKVGTSPDVPRPAISQKQAAEIVGVSVPQIQRAKAVIESGDQKLIEQVTTGQKSLEAAAKQAVEQKRVIKVAEAPQTRQQRKPNFILLDHWAGMPDEDRHAALNPKDSTATLNKQDTESIEWARWSWNPLTGCKHDCPYCYARDIANRFFEQKFEVSFYPERLSAPANTKVPDIANRDISYKNIFCCSMADLFGRWVPDEWINAVLDVVRKNPQWNFLFLTKFPKRMAEFDIPVNAWMGTSVDLQARVKAAEDAFSKVNSGVKWLSIEPMLEPLQFSNLSVFDWVVIGGSSRSNETPEWVPPFDWINSLHNQARQADCAVYHKTNLGMTDALRLKEFPWQERQEKTLPAVFNYLGKK